MIVRPYLDRVVDALMREPNPGDPGVALENMLEPDKPCLYCGLPILPNQWKWLWQFGGEVGMLQMHTDCARDWFPRAMLDFAKIAKQGDAE